MEASQTVQEDATKVGNSSFSTPRRSSMMMEHLSPRRIEITPTRCVRKIITPKSSAKAAKAFIVTNIDLNIESFTDSRSPSSILKRRRSLAENFGSMNLQPFTPKKACKKSVKFDAPESASKPSSSNNLSSKFTVLQFSRLVISSNFFLF